MEDPVRHLFKIFSVFLYARSFSPRWTMANVKSTFNLVQTVFPQHTSTITVSSYDEVHLSERTFDLFLSSVVTGKIGLAPTYDEQQRLKSIAFASSTRVLIITLSKGGRTITLKRELLAAKIFMNDSLTKYGFHMDKFVTSLFTNLSLKIVGAIDILSLWPQRRHLFRTMILALGGESEVDKANVMELFREEESCMAGPFTVATQAWVAYKAALVHPASAPPRTINTTIFSAEELNFLGKTISDAERLRNLKPVVVENEIEREYKLTKGALSVQCSRYKTKIMRPGSNQVMQVELTRNGKASTTDAKLRRLQGKMAQLSFSGASQAEKLSIRTIGREDPTSAEAFRTHIIFQVIYKETAFLTFPFVLDIWFPKRAKPMDSSVPVNSIPIAFDSRPLNESQRSAVKAILSDNPSDRLVLIQGPPGTGKTTVIAAAVISAISFRSSEQGLWLVAQSNVAVKNIAEKLADVEFFDFKLLVSKDFHFDWHEHLYNKIEQNVIRSDDFVDRLLVAERVLKGSRVILCTLSMLSNDRIAGFTRVVPPSCFIFDEASQIEVGDYIPMLYQYRKTTQKLVFIGDDKQLPPYGQSDIDGLQSVFELPHLRRGVHFLNTQYRMPIPIGNFISKKFYHSRLESSHSIRTNNCCRFIDVNHGSEMFRGRSWINEQQAQVVLALARKMENLKLSYRIITPYDAQRSFIESQLKGNNLKWEDKVFNVDSFQGNEDDYIIISLVRTKRIGFLKDLRRLNVMLTRCKRGMIICTDKHFVNDVASRSPVAGLAKALGSNVWVPWRNVLQPSYRPFAV